MNKTLDNTFSEKSLELLSALDETLRAIAVEVRKESKIRFEITETLRDIKTQQKYYAEGKSQIDGIIKKGKHQARESDGKSEAVDIICYDPKTNKPTYDRKELYYYVAGLFEAKVKELNRKPVKELNQAAYREIKIQWGGWWSFEDCVHFEIR